MPFKADLDRTPIMVGSDYRYVDLHSAVKTWESIISATLTVPASAKSLAELLAAVTTDVTDEVADDTPNDVLTSFSGTLAPHPYMNIEDDTSVTFTATVGAVPIDITETGSGVLSGDGGDITGTIDYVTGEWTLEFTDAPDDTTDIVVDYTWFYVVPSTVTIQGLWMLPGVDDEIYVTYSEDGIPTATTGMLLSEAIFLAGQPNLIANAKFYGNNTALNVEVLI